MSNLKMHLISAVLFLALSLSGMPVMLQAQQLPDFIEERPRDNLYLHFASGAAVPLQPSGFRTGWPARPDFHAAISIRTSPRSYVSLTAGYAAFRRSLPMGYPAIVQLVSLIPTVMLIQPVGRLAAYGQLGLGGVKDSMTMVNLQEGHLTFASAATRRIRTSRSLAVKGVAGIRMRIADPVLIYMEAGYMGAMMMDGVLAYAPLRFGVALDLSGAAGRLRF